MGEQNKEPMPAERLRFGEPRRYLVNIDSISTNQLFTDCVIVGAGVAGLTVAHDLARAGYKVTVFEADEVPGGMLTLGVPRYRLPRELVKAEIDAIVSLGVELRLNTPVGIHDNTISHTHVNFGTIVCITILHGASPPPRTGPYHVISPGQGVMSQVTSIGNVALVQMQDGGGSCTT